MLAPRHLEQQRLGSLRQMRQPRLEHWRDITQNLLPYAGRYLAGDRDRAVGEYQDIIDETGTNALEILGSGMHANRTSPAREWFRPQTPDAKTNRRHDARQWFQIVVDVIRTIFRRSNTDLILPGMYEEGGAFGVSASIMVEDRDTVIWQHPMTAGEFLLATDGRGRVDTCYREFSMTVAEMVKEFGFDRCSNTVQRMHRTGLLDSPVPVVHAIEPRSDRDPRLRDKRNMPWKSVYFEADAPSGQYLRESGFERFPVLAPRWRVRGNDVWGEGPATKALGSTRQLQAEQLLVAGAAEYQGNPPVQIPTSAVNRDHDLLPGGKLPYDQNTPHGGVRVAFEPPLRLDYMHMLIEDVRRRINASFHVPLFQTLQQLNDATERTRLEILQRKEEALTVLGPVTQRYHLELDQPLIEFALERAMRVGLVPAPPAALHLMPLEIEYIGPLAQALKSISAQNDDRFVSQLGVVAALKPDATDKFDADAWVDMYADKFNIDPSLIVPGEKVALLRKARAEAQAAAQQAEVMAKQAGAVRDLAGASTGERNAFTDIATQLTGYGNPAMAG